MGIFTFSPIYTHLLLAMALGMILGLERFIAHKTAGMRTYTLVSIGAALFVIISELVVAKSNIQYFDPLRVAAQVVAAAGFLGIGAIFHTVQGGVSGMTTATGLWVAAGVGMACGFGLYKLAVFVTLLALVTFVVLWFIEKQIRKLPIKNNEGNQPL